jgi:hypothetical protein
MLQEVHPGETLAVQIVSLQAMWCQVAKVSAFWKAELVNKLVNYVT